MKKWLIILLNIVLCIAHGLCLVFLESFMSVPLIWSDVGFSLNASILGCVLLDLVVHYLVFIQMSKRGVLVNLLFLHWDVSITCYAVFCLLWIGLFLYMMSPWTACLQVAFVVGMNAIVILVRKFICPVVIKRTLKQRWENGSSVHTD